MCDRYSSFGTHAGCKTCHYCGLVLFPLVKTFVFADTLVRTYSRHSMCKSPENASVLQELKAQHKDRLQLVTLDVADSSSIQVRQWMHDLLL